MKFVSEFRKSKTKKSERLGYLKLPEGETKLTLLPKVPQSRTAQFKDGPKEQLIFYVSIDGKEYMWTRTRDSTMADELVDLLVKAPVTFTVLRDGLDLDTRYTIL